MFYLNQTVGETRTVLLGACVFIWTCVSLVELSQHSRAFSFSTPHSFHLTTLPAGPKPILINTGILLDHCWFSTSYTSALTVIKCWSRGWGPSVLPKMRMVCGVNTHTHIHMMLSTWGSLKTISVKVNWEEMEPHQAVPQSECLWVFMCSPACMTVCQWPTRQECGYGWVAMVSMATHTHRGACWQMSYTVQGYSRRMERNDCTL